MKKITKILNFDNLVLTKVKKMTGRGLPIAYGQAIKVAYAISRFLIIIGVNYNVVIFIAVKVVFARGSLQALNKRIKINREEKVIKILLGICKIIVAYKVANFILSFIL